MQLDDLDLQYSHGLWLGAVPTRFGMIELLLGGTPDQPDEKDVASFLRFADELDANILKLRKKVPFAFFYHPIRIAINNEKRVGVQFRNWITKNQSTLILEEQ